MLFFLAITGSLALAILGCLAIVFGFIWVGQLTDWADGLKSFRKGTNMTLEDYGNRISKLEIGMTRGQLDRISDTKSGPPVIWPTVDFGH